MMNFLRKIFNVQKSGLAVTSGGVTTVEDTEELVKRQREQLLTDAYFWECHKRAIKILRLESDKRRLINLLLERSYERKHVILSCGKESDFFIDCKQTVLTAEGHYLVGKLMLEALQEEPFAPVDIVAGVTLGGCSLASAVSLKSYEDVNKDSLPAIYVRKAHKDHGSKKLIEGDKSIRKGMRVAILEDVVTTGDSSIRTASVLRDAGLDVVGVVAIVDRLEGAQEAFKEVNLPFVSLTTKNDFMSEQV